MRSSARRSRQVSPSEFSEAAPALPAEAGSAVEDGATAEPGGGGALGGDECLNARSRCVPLHATGLGIETAQGIKFVRAAKMRLADRAFQDAQRLVVDS